MTLTSSRLLFTWSRSKTVAFGTLGLVLGRTLIFLKMNMKFFSENIIFIFCRHGIFSNSFCYNCYFSYYSVNLPLFFFRLNGFNLCFFLLAFFCYGLSMRLNNYFRFISDSVNEIKNLFNAGGCVSGLFF